MKALTIKEPWASLIINQYKIYEFRSWKTNYRGKILIHAGLTTVKEEALKFEQYNLDYQNGKIIGEAEIIDCIKVTKDFDFEIKKENNLVYGDDHLNLYAWKLENIKKYDNPIECKGKLGLWNIEI